MSSILQASAVAVIALGTGAATVSALREEPHEVVIPDGPWDNTGALDGRTFHTRDVIAATGEEMTDVLTFVGGTFQSLKCQEYCDFGWSQYRTWQDGTVTHFTAETRCPDAPHSVVWRGIVDGDTLRFDATWTTRRWYWTQQIDVTGEGVPAPRPAADSTG